MLSSVTCCCHFYCFASTWGQIQSGLEHCISAAVIIWVNCHMPVCGFVDGLWVPVGSALESCVLSIEVSMQMLNSKVSSTQWGRLLSYLCVKNLSPFWGVWQCIFSHCHFCQWLLFYQYYSPYVVPHDFGFLQNWIKISWARNSVILLVLRLWKHPWNNGFEQMLQL